MTDDRELLENTMTHEGDTVSEQWPEFDKHPTVQFEGITQAIMCEEDYNRARLCVNACAGKSNELLQSVIDYDNSDNDASWEAPHPIFQMAEDVDRLNARNAALEQQRGELLTALKVYGYHKNGCIWPELMPDECGCGLRQAIAKADT